MLLAQDSGERILDRPAAELLEQSTVTELDLGGQTISHYRIVEKLGVVGRAGQIRFAVHECTLRNTLY
jgi:hypothetical protein